MLCYQDYFMYSVLDITELLWSCVSLVKKMTVHTYHSSRYFNEIRVSTGRRLSRYGISKFIVRIVVVVQKVISSFPNLFFFKQWRIISDTPIGHCQSSRIHARFVMVLKVSPRRFRVGIFLKRRFRLQKIFRLLFDHVKMVPDWIESVRSRFRRDSFGRVQIALVLCGRINCFSLSFFLSTDFLPFVS